MNKAHYQMIDNELFFWLIVISHFTLNIIYKSFIIKVDFKGDSI